MVLLYVDDVFICGPSIDAMESVMDKIATRFKSRIDRETKTILGNVVGRGPTGIKLHSKPLIHKMLRRFVNSQTKRNFTLQVKPKIDTSETLLVSAEDLKN